MNIVDQLDTVRNWVEETVCSHVRLKLPDDDKTGAGASYRLVRPAAFVQYMPGADRLPEGIDHEIPCVCVQLVEGSSQVQRRGNSAQLRLVFACWNPGTHDPDILPPTPTVEGQLGEGPEAPAQSEAAVVREYRRGADGWRDVWAFVDVAVRALESTNIIGGGVKVNREAPIKYGPVTEQDDIVDFWPYWYAWLTFEIETGTARNNASERNNL